MVKKILVACLIVLIVIQFFRPARNVSAQLVPTDITHVTNVPADVQAILKRSCNDCHSNNTSYPWYMEVQPVAWYLAHHIDEGKRELNFSEFGSYSQKRQLHKLEEIAKEVEEGEMPLSSYTLIHRNARLSAAETARLVQWSDSAAADIRRGAAPAGS